MSHLQGTSERVERTSLSRRRLRKVMSSTREAAFRRAAATRCRCETAICMEIWDPEALWRQYSEHSLEFLMKLADYVREAARQAGTGIATPAGIDGRDCRACETACVACIEGKSESNELRQRLLRDGQRQFENDLVSSERYVLVVGQHAPAAILARQDCTR